MLMAAALLARETSAIVVPLLAGEAVLRRRYRHVMPMVLAVVPFLLWQLYVAWRCGEPSWRGGTAGFGTPLAGLWHYGTGLLGHGHPAERIYFAIFLANIMTTLPVAAADLWEHRDGPGLAFAAFALMPFIMSSHVWIEPWSYGRVLVTSAAVLLFAHGRTPRFRYLTGVPLALNAVLTLITIKWLHIV